MQRQVFIFDESTSSLDIKNEMAIINYISTFKGSKTLIVISHKTSVLKDCNKIYRIQSSELAETDL